MPHSLSAGADVVAEIHPADVVLDDVVYGKGPPAGQTVKENLVGMHPILDKGRRFAKYRLWMIKLNDKTEPNDLFFYLLQGLDYCFEIRFGQLVCPVFNFVEYFDLLGRLSIKLLELKEKMVNRILSTKYFGFAQGLLVGVLVLVLMRATGFTVGMLMVVVQTCRFFFVVSESWFLLAVADV